MSASRRAVDLVNHAGEALRNIVGTIKDVAVLVADIACASTELAQDSTV